MQQDSVRPFQFVGVNGQSQVRKAAQERIKRNGTLHTSQRGAEAVMNPVAEGDMPVRRPGDVIGNTLYGVS